MEDDYLAKLQHCILPRSIPDNLPNLIHTDSRSLVKGQWFLPIAGANFDGHDYIDDVLSKGAAGFFYSESNRGKISHLNLDRGIPVNDTVEALQSIARCWRSRFKNLKVIGITGSSGKTTLKELCSLMLKGFGPTLKTEGSLNNELGVPLTLCRLTPSDQYAVIEMGARHVGDIDFLSGIADQDLGVLANVGNAHIGEFGSAENILKAKMEIARASTCVYPRDDARIHQAMSCLKNRKLVSFGHHPESIIQIVEQRFRRSGGISLKVKIDDKVFEQDFSYFHDSFSINVACALAVAYGLNLDLRKALEKLTEFAGLKGRFQIHKLGDLTLIDDAYNANPLSMLAGLETLRKAYDGVGKTIILGDMNELGDSSEQSHRSVGVACQKFFPEDRLVTIGKQARWIAEAAIQSGMNENLIDCYPDVDALLPVLSSKIKGTQLLYVKASNSLKLNKIIDTLLSR